MYKASARVPSEPSTAGNPQPAKSRAARTAGSSDGVEDRSMRRTLAVARTFAGRSGPCPIVQTMWSERHRGGTCTREAADQTMHRAPAQQHVRPVTEVGIAPWCRGGPSSKAITRLQDHHLVTRGRCLEGRGQPARPPPTTTTRCMLRPHDGTAWALRKGRVLS